MTVDHDVDQSALVVGDGSPTAMAVPPIPTGRPAMHDPALARSGADLIKATRSFQDESRLVSWLLLVSTAGVMASALFAVFWVPWWPLKIVSGIIAGLIQVRLFIFYHDTLHGAIFRHSRLAQLLMGLLGIYLVTPQKVWRESHDFHHQNNAKMMGSTIGSYPLMCSDRMGQLPRRQRWAYIAARHPLTILFGYLTVFIFGMVIAPFLRSPRGYWQGLLAVLVHGLQLVLIGHYCGWTIAVCAVIVPSFVSMAVGSYLFYAQHNFPTMHLAERRDWNLTAAAIQASSMFDMSRLMHWFTGNIGYHHVHHVNHLVPFYRLPEAMRGIPELQNPERTSWKVKDIRGCLNLFVWDRGQRKMLTQTDTRG